MPGYYSKESVQHSEHGESLKPRITQWCPAVLHGHLHAVWARYGQPFPVRYGTSSPAPLHLHSNPSPHGMLSTVGGARTRWPTSNIIRHDRPPTTANSSRPYAHYMSATDIYTHIHSHTPFYVHTKSKPAPLRAKQTRTGRTSTALPSPDPA
jgi:hypothetical protein